MDRKIEINERAPGRPIVTEPAPPGPTPTIYQPRIDALTAMFAEAYHATRAHSTIPRTPSGSRARVYRWPDGTEEWVENHAYESHLLSPLEEIDGERCAQSVRVLGEAAGRWAEALAEQTGKPLARLFLQERQAPEWSLYQRNWNLFVGWTARGAIVVLPPGVQVSDINGADR